MGQGTVGHQSVLPAATESKYRGMVKGLTDDPFMNSLLSDPDTQFFDKDHMPNEYQVAADKLGLAQNRDLVGSSRSKDFKGIVDAAGKFIGALGKAVGLGKNSDLKTFTCMRLPKKANGSEVDIGYGYMPYSSSGGGGESYLDFWKYGVGTQFCEVVFGTDPSTGNPYVAEIRTQRRMPGGGWIPDVYRRFPTADSMISRIKEVFAGTWNEPGSRINNLVKHLEDKSRLKETSISDDYFAKVLSGKGAIDKLPPLSKEEASRLIAGTPLKSSLGEVWDSNKNGAKSFAPTSDLAFHAVPPTDDMHAIAVSTKSCTQCHRMTGTNIGMLRPNEINSFTKAQTPESYLSTWSANACPDGAPSFNPYRPAGNTRFDGLNTDLRRANGIADAAGAPDFRAEFQRFMKPMDAARSANPNYYQ